MEFHDETTGASCSDSDTLSFSILDSDDGDELDEAIAYHRLNKSGLQDPEIGTSNFQCLSPQRIVVSSSASMEAMQAGSWTSPTSSRTMGDGVEKRGSKGDRKSAKQLTERKRRDRINALLDTLRTLILRLLNKNPRHHRKLEKADILELVVSFLKRELHRKATKAPHTSDKPRTPPEPSQSVRHYCEPRCSSVETGITAPLRDTAASTQCFNMVQYHPNFNRTGSSQHGASDIKSTIQMPSGARSRRPLASLANYSMPTTFESKLNTNYPPISQSYLPSVYTLTQSQPPECPLWLKLPGGYQQDENYCHVYGHSDQTALWRPYV